MWEPAKDRMEIFPKNGNKQHRMLYLYKSSEDRTLIVAHPLLVASTVIEHAQSGNCLLACRFLRRNVVEIESHRPRRVIQELRKMLSFVRLVFKTYVKFK